MIHLAKAIEIASIAHVNQLDKADEPYILHPLRVMMNMDSYEEKIVAVLHDVVEDTAWTIKTLSEYPFSKRVIEAIDALSRREKESVKDYYGRIIKNRLAVRVKIRDLEDNMNITRLNIIGEGDLNRLKIYHEHWLVLNEALKNF